MSWYIFYGHLIESEVRGNGVADYLTSPNSHLIYIVRRTLPRCEFIPILRHHIHSTFGIPLWNDITRKLRHQI